jgi:hypothetical protein
VVRLEEGEEEEGGEGRRLEGEQEEEGGEGWRRSCRS